MLAAGAGQRKGQARPVRVVAGPGNALTPTAEGGSAGGRRLGTGPRKGQARALGLPQGCLWTSWRLFSADSALGWL